MGSKYSKHTSVYYAWKDHPVVLFDKQRNSMKVLRKGEGNLKNVEGMEEEEVQEGENHKIIGRRIYACEENIP